MIEGLGRHPTLPARATSFLAFADEVVTAAQDRYNRALPWSWWPVGPPTPRRPISPAAHVLAGVQIVGGTLAPEPLLRAFGELPTGRRLWAERALSVLVGAAAWLVAAGAWDRRAARRSLAGRLRLR